MPGTETSPPPHHGVTRLGLAIFHFAEYPLNGPALQQNLEQSVSSEVSKLKYDSHPDQEMEELKGVGGAGP